MIIFQPIILFFNLTAILYYFILRLFHPLQRVLILQPGQVVAIIEEDDSDDEEVLLHFNRADVDFHNENRDWMMVL